MGKGGLSNSEEKLRRQATKQEDKLAIDLYRECYALADLHSLAVCAALRAKHPKLARVFAQLECHTDHAQTVNLQPEEKV